MISRKGNESKLDDFCWGCMRKSTSTSNNNCYTALPSFRYSLYSCAGINGYRLLQFAAATAPFLSAHVFSAEPNENATGKIHYPRAASWRLPFFLIDIAFLLPAFSPPLSQWSCGVNSLTKCKFSGNPKKEWVKFRVAATTFLYNILEQKKARNVGRATTNRPRRRPKKTGT